MVLIAFCSLQLFPVEGEGRKGPGRTKGVCVFYLFNFLTGKCYLLFLRYCYCPSKTSFILP